MSVHVMLDLETLGTKPGCAIVSIGAVRWGDNEPGQRHLFKRNVTIKANLRIGLNVDGDTLQWWLTQPAETQQRAFAAGVEDMAIALANLSQFACGNITGPASNVFLWSKGTHFDNAILLAAYDRAKLTPFWNYKNNRDYRTLAAMLPGIPEPTRAGTHHDALDDAIHQAAHLQAILAHLQPV